MKKVVVRTVLLAPYADFLQGQVPARVIRGPLRMLQDLRCNFSSRRAATLGAPKVKGEEE